MKTLQELITEAKKHVHEVSIDNADAAIACAAVVLDIPEPSEFEAGHLPSAVNIPRGLLEFKLGDLPQINTPQAKIIMYCKTDGRCALAARTLQQMGYTKIQSLARGLDAWIQAGKPVTRT